MKNHFEILNVKPSDSDKKVFLAYRKLSSNNHPKKDKTKYEYFLQVHMSYEVLRYEERRNFYYLLMSKPDKNSEENEKRIAGFENRGRINGELFAENSNLFHKKVTYFAIADILIDFLGIIIAGEILNLGLLLGLIISIVGFILGISIIFEFNLPFLILSPCLVVNGFLIVRHQLIKHAMHVGK